MVDPSGTMERLTRLEAESRRLRWMTLALCALLILSLTASRPGAQQAVADVLRVKGLVVEDAAGRAAIVLGAPMAEGANSRTGLKIVDPTGRERIGISIVPNGDAVIGLDAPRGTGDERNPERINLNADAKGGRAHPLPRSAHERRRADVPGSAESSVAQLQRFRADAGGHSPVRPDRRRSRPAEPVI